MLTIKTKKTQNGHIGQLQNGKTWTIKKIKMSCKDCEKKPAYINGLCANCTKLINPKEASILDLISLMKIQADEISNILVQEDLGLVEETKEERL